MDEIINQSIHINELIKKSSEYKWYTRADKKLHEHVDLYNQLKEYRRRNSELQNLEGINPYDEVVALVKEYDVLLHNSIVSDFLKAEVHLCSVLETVYNRIIEGLEFDYLDE
ncbi:MAG: YlbF family regulator [Clostridium sp.]|nr:YlbF family regulator [Clostridium sp.]MCM1170816.1 YlbF family regulator [Clostridium sp.]MCM1209798.1 YlbF family regulator [Ruminococcus sp.]